MDHDPDAGYKNERIHRRPVSPGPFLHFTLILLASFLFVRLLIELIQRLRSRRAKPEHAPGEIEVEAPRPPAPPIPEVPTTIPGEIPFGAPAPIAPPLADPYLTIPPDLALESFEPKYQFNWQNPNLLEDIYPHRIEKLIDFLAYLTEIELIREYRSKGLADPAIQAKIKQSEAELRAERQEVESKLTRLIEEKKQTDPFFGKITGLNEKNLRFKQTYYLGREIQRLQDKLDDLEERKITLLKRVDWYPDGDPRGETWRTRADDLDPQIEEVRARLAKEKAFRDLFDQEAQLPNLDLQQASIEDVVRWRMREEREQWKQKADETVLECQERLLIEIVNNWFRRDPDRFPEWLIYMVIHFSGMRYKSAHGTWAEPRFLLELLFREDLESDIDHYDAPTLAAACAQAVQELQRQIASLLDDPKRRSISHLITRLQNPIVQKRALLEYCTARAIEEVQALPGEDACLNRLVQYKQEREAQGKGMPAWVWAEIVKYTPLRLQTEDPDWEAFSPERWKWTKEHWRETLSTWQQKDITAWRQKHRESLDLIVTRAVCNEIAEHIQHLRGLTPGAGLTAKPAWYLRLAARDPQRAYFVQAPDEEDFKPGASILWLQWVDRPPNAWQVARPLPGFSFLPEQGRQARKPKRGQKGEVRKRDLDLDRDGTRKRGSQQYLRWSHEATVIEVVDMASGKYVVTFETGQIGVILRRMSDLRGNPVVFVGYVPGLPGLPEELDQKLVEMLRWDRILPGTNLPPRVRPRAPTPNQQPIDITG